MRPTIASRLLEHLPHAIATLLLVLVAADLVNGDEEVKGESQERRAPNIVFILADDRY